MVARKSGRFTALLAAAPLNAAIIGLVQFISCFPYATN
jgi:hypothetical protein